MKARSWPEVSVQLTAQALITLLFISQYQTSDPPTLLPIHVCNSVVICCWVIESFPFSASFAINYFLWVTPTIGFICRAAVVA